MAIKKFTDEQFLELYNNGFNDTEISKFLNVSNQAVTIRRWKLNLLPNYRIQYNSIPKYNYKKYLIRATNYVAKKTKTYKRINFILFKYIYLQIYANAETGNYVRSSIYIH